MIEPESLPPGHPPVRDIELDIDALKAQWKDRPEVAEAPIGSDPPRKVHSHDHGAHR